MRRTTDRTLGGSDVTDSDDERRAWFQNYVAKCAAGVAAAPSPGVRYPCPCCGYPTLSSRGGYEICCLCSWEDNGQDDPHADEVWGGPNGPYSLTEARENFREHLVMYYAGADTRGGGADSVLELDAKRGMMAAFDAMPAAPDDAALAALWEQVRAADRVLEAEIERRILEFEPDDN